MHFAIRHYSRFQAFSPAVAHLAPIGLCFSSLSSKLLENQEATEKAGEETKQNIVNGLKLGEEAVAEQTSALSNFSENNNSTSESIRADMSVFFKDVALVHLHMPFSLTARACNIICLLHGTEC